MKQENKLTNILLIILILFLVTLTVIAFSAWKNNQMNQKETNQELQKKVFDLEKQLSNQDKMSQKDIEENSDTSQKVNEIEVAENTLIKYFNLLNEKKYKEATQYHGSGYEYIQEWNPSLSLNDYSKLLKNGCEINGLQCLKIKEVIEREQISPTKFKFTVKFIEETGFDFKAGPCCPLKVTFDFYVEKSNNNYIVTTQPIFTP